MSMRLNQAFENQLLTIYAVRMEKCMHIPFPYVTQFEHIFFVNTDHPKLKMLPKKTFQNRRNKTFCFQLKIILSWCINHDLRMLFVPSSSQTCVKLLVCECMPGFHDNIQMTTPIKILNTYDMFLIYLLRN